MRNNNPKEFFKYHAWFMSYRCKSPLSCNLAHPVLDPRFKSKNLETDILNQVKEDINSLMTETSAISNNQSQNNNSVLYHKSDDESRVDELEAYLSSGRINSQSDALLWWSVARKQYPKLSDIAAKILCIQATSVASERVFFIAGGVDTKSRNGLRDESVENNILFKSWIQYLNID